MHQRDKFPNSLLVLRNRGFGAEKNARANFWINAQRAHQ